MKYSRRATVEEKRNIRTAVILISLTLAGIAFLFTLGLPSIAKFAGFLTDLTKSGKPVEVNDTTPPAPPHFNDLPDATNSAKLNISGGTEPGATVTVTINNQDQEVVANSDGNFSLTYSLHKGENDIWGVAKDAAGNTSQKSQTVKVIFDNEPPKIVISSPADGTSFFGSRQRQVTVSGTVDAGASLTVNDRFVSVADDGSFSYTFSLSEGDNNLTFEATDVAQNQTEKSMTLHFSP